MIYLSQAAASEVKRLGADRKRQAMFRLGVRPGGCSGILYTLDFDDTVKADDRLFDCNGIQVVVAAESLNYIDGLTLDYTEDLMGGGFRFYNPNAEQNCGCGNSFAPSDRG